MFFDDTRLTIFHFTGVIYQTYDGKQGLTGLVRSNNELLTYTWKAIAPGYIPKPMDRVNIQAVEYYPKRFMITKLSKYK